MSKQLEELITAIIEHVLEGLNNEGLTLSEIQLIKQLPGLYEAYRQITSLGASQAEERLTALEKEVASLKNETTSMRVISQEDITRFIKYLDCHLHEAIGDKALEL